MADKFLLKGGCVLTLGPRTPNFTEGDVLIEEGRVADVGPGLSTRDAEVVDAADTIVMPGFVDCHRHAWKSLLRNAGGPESASTSSDSSNHYTPDDVYAATLVGLLGAIEAGVTTVVDWSDIPTDDDHVDAALSAHADAALRTVHVCSAPEGASEQDRIAHSLRRLVADPSHPVALTTVAFGSPESIADDLEQLGPAWGDVRALGIRIHAHAGRDASATGRVDRMESAGLLSDDVTLIHCTHLTREELNAVAARGASVVLTPSTEMAGGVGSPPVQQIIDRGIRPGLGVDDEHFAPGDMFAQMRATISLQHATLFDLKLGGKAGVPQLLTTRDVLRYATLDGARAVGLGDVTGSIEKGKAADIIVLRADRPNIAPVNDPIGAVVWGVDTSNLDWVFVAGRPLMRGGILAADSARARQLATAALQRVAATAGPLVEPAPGGGI